MRKAFWEGASESNAREDLMNAFENALNKYCVSQARRLSLEADPHLQRREARKLGTRRQSPPRTASSRATMAMSRESEKAVDNSHLLNYLTRDQHEAMKEKLNARLYELADELEDMACSKQEMLEKAVSVRFLNLCDNMRRLSRSTV